MSLQFLLAVGKWQNPSENGKSVGKWQNPSENGKFIDDIRTMSQWSTDNKNVFLGKFYETINIHCIIIPKMHMKMNFRDILKTLFMILQLP